MSEIGKFIQTITRPFCLAVMVVVIALMVYQGKVVPTWTWGTFIPMFFWWSVDRTLSHLSQRKSLANQPKTQG